MFNLTETEKSIIEFVTIISGLFIFALFIPNIATFLVYEMDEFIKNMKNEQIYTDLEYKNEFKYENDFKEINEKIVVIQNDIKHLEKTINVCTEIVQILVDKKK